MYVCMHIGMYVCVCVYLLCLHLKTVPKIADCIAAYCLLYVLFISVLSQQGGSKV
jgi:hypothetical protein